MAPLLEDPRLRQTWNSISHNAETVTETAATGIWQFLHNYINPCFVSIGESLDSCTTACFPNREERHRRARDRTRGRAEYSFDFYDDWDDDIQNSGGGLLGWGNDELDRLLAGSGSHSHGSNEQPSGRKRKMSYGTRRSNKRKGTIDGLPDPTVIPSTSAIGFLQRLPFKFGSTLRYKPSAADLQDHPGAHRAELFNNDEIEPLIENEHGDTDDNEAANAIKTRERSTTQSSGETSDSFRSRGDLFPSDDEADAVPLPDEFAISLTGRSVADDRSSGSRTKLGKGKGRDSASQLSRTRSRASHSSNRSLATMGEPSPLTRVISTSSFPDDNEGQTLSDLEHEEEQALRDEEEELRRKREAASRLAAKRGLSMTDAPASRADGAEDAIEPDYFTTTDMSGRTTSVLQDTTSSPLESPRAVQESTSEEPVLEQSISEVSGSDTMAAAASQTNAETPVSPEPTFVPARLPKF